MRDVWLVEYEGRPVAVKTLRHMEDPRHRDMHTKEMLTMDVVSEGARCRSVRAGNIFDRLNPTNMDYMYIDCHGGGLFSQWLELVPARRFGVL